MSEVEQREREVSLAELSKTNYRVRCEAGDCTESFGHILDLFTHMHEQHRDLDPSERLLSGQVGRFGDE